MFYPFIKKLIIIINYISSTNFINFYFASTLANTLVGNLNGILYMYFMQYLFPYIKINEIKNYQKKKKNLFTFESFTEL